MERENLIFEITEAFKDVELDGGIGLSEADALDSYMNDSVIAECKINDEKYIWQNIRVNDLNKYHNGISFMDAKGMRFHLAAIMITMLNNQYRFDIPYALTDTSGNSYHLFSLFSQKQKQAVRLFLEYLMTKKDYDFDKANLRIVIDNFWSL